LFCFLQELFSSFFKPGSVRSPHTITTSLIPPGRFRTRSLSKAGAKVDGFSFPTIGIESFFKNILRVFITLCHWLLCLQKPKFMAKTIATKGKIGSIERHFSVATRELPSENNYNCTGNTHL
ncbi:MAG: hypothetical protein IKO46_04945, partial [Salinivirgaceae bacterium]|nr:hypothetical protein [Bacteroidales bacterium]MBR4620308.1 hypothetical protein [Salinivirgaceae bacterium]